MQLQDKLTRNAVRVWMRQVLEDKNWTASEWAKRAGTSPTNISRVLSPTSEIIPTSATLAKLSRAAGSQPNLGAYQRVIAERVPLRSLDRLMETNPDKTIIAPVELSDEAFAVKITTDAMNGAGIMEGDVVFCEPINQVPPTIGKIVVAHANGTGFIGKFAPPWLMPQSTGAHNPQPLAELEIIGVCVMVTRPLP
jgi:hypothetical protein